MGPAVAAVSIDQFFPFVHADARHDWALFSTLTEATLATAVALANGGLHVIVDTVFERIDSLHALGRVLASHTHHLVAVTCQLEALEAREARRGDRRIGQARDQHARVFHDASYALRLDTSRMSLDECVDVIVALLHPP